MFQLQEPILFRQLPAFMKKAVAITEFQVKTPQIMVTVEEAVEHHMPHLQFQVLLR